MTNQYVLVLAGSVFDVVTVEDVNAYIVANFAMPNLVIAVEHRIGMKLSTALEQSIERAKEAGIW